MERNGKLAYQVPPPALVVADEEAQAAAFVKRALIRHRVHQNERVRPPDFRLQLRLAAVLSSASKTRLSTSSF